MFSHLFIDLFGFKFYQLAICLPFVLPYFFSVAPFLHSFANFQAPPKPAELETVGRDQQLEFRYSPGDSVVHSMSETTALWLTVCILKLCLESILYHFTADTSIVFLKLKIIIESSDLSGSPTTLL